MAALRLGEIEQSVGALELLALESPDDWRLANDLGVALLNRALTSADRGVDLPRALRAVLAAKALEPEAPPLLFNLALIRSHLGLHRSADAAWRAFLASSDDADRVAVARAWIERLEHERSREWDGAWAISQGRGSSASSCESAAVRDPRAAYEHALGEALAQWAAAAQRGDQSDSTRLRQCGLSLGAQLEARGDGLVLDTFSRLPESLEGGRAASVAGVVLTAVEGARAFEESRYEDALSLLGTAATALGRLEEFGPAAPFVWRLRFYEIYARFHRDVAAADTDLASLATQLGEGRYPSLRAQLEWRRGVSAATQGRFEQALAHYREGMAIKDRLFGPTEAAFGNTLIAEALDLAGDTETAWVYRLRGLASSYAASPRRAHSTLTEAVWSLLEEGDIESALPFLDEQLAHAEAGGNPEYLVESHRARGRAYAMLGRDAEASRDLAAARSWLQAMGSGARQADLSRGLDLDQGMVLGHSDPAEADRLLTAVFEAAIRVGNDIDAVASLRYRAAARKVLGDVSGAEADLREALDRFEQRRLGAGADLAIFALRPAQGAFDELTSLLLQQGRFDEAFDTAERARARFLLDRRDGTAPLGSSQVLQRLPPEVVLVSFAVLGDQVAAWVFANGELNASPSLASLSRLRPAIELYRLQLERGGGGAEVRIQGRHVYEALFGSLELDLRSGVRLVVVPDRELFLVPVGALVDPSDRYLFELAPVSIAPSVSLAFVGDRGREHGGPRHVLAVAPLSEKALGRALPALPGARREAEEVIRVHRGGTLLVAGAGTVSEFLLRLPEADLVHFAGHAMANRRDPLQSRLVFAAETGGGPSELSAAELMRLAEPPPAMFVMSACRSAQVGLADREALLGLAGALVASGVDSVVAAGWDVDDRSSVPLMVSFHEHVAGGADAATAWRETVLEVLRSGDEKMASPATWGGFTVLEVIRGG